MEKGMIFDVQQEGKETFMAMAINDKQTVILETLEIVDIDFENEVEEIFIENIFNLY